MRLFFLLFLSSIFSGAYAQKPVVSVNGPSVICDGLSAQNIFFATATNSPKYYKWTVVPNITGVSILNGSTSNPTILFPDEKRNYTVSCSAVNSNGEGAPKSVVVKVQQKLNVSFSGATTFCQGSSTILSASSTAQSASNTISFNWFPSTGLNTTNGSTVIASPGNSTTYTLTAQSGNCSVSEKITVNPITILPVTFSGATSFCQGSSTIISASATVIGASPTVSYSWSPSYYLNNSASSTVTAYNYYPVTYTVTAQQGNCISKGNITLNPIQVLPVSFSGETTFCQGSSTILSASATIGSASSTLKYTWQPSTGLNTTNGSTVTASPNNPVTYTVTATNGSGCSSASSITVGPLESFPITIYGSRTFCKGSSAYLYSTVNNQQGSSTISYNWQPSSGINLPDNQNVEASPQVPTTYTLTASKGACSIKETITITPIEVLPITFSGDTLFCQGSSTILSASTTIQAASSTLAYYWWPYNGLNTYYGSTVIASPNVATTYYIYAYDYNSGCYSTSSIAVIPINCDNTSSSGSMPEAVTGIQKTDVLPSNYLNIYPNPNNGAFNIKSNKPERIVIINELGETIKTIDIAADTEYQVSGLLPGVYVISSDSFKNKKLVVTH